jgi:two-component system, NarL family, sensor histidine kinase LiaS
MFLSAFDWKKTMLKKRFTRPFRHLQGKLTLSYALTTVATLLILEALFIGIALWLSTLNTSFFFSRALVQEAPTASTYFVHGSPDREALKAWLQIVQRDIPFKNGPFYFSPLFFAVVDKQGQTIASIGTHPVPDDVSLQTQLSPQNNANLQAMLRGTTGTTSNVDTEAGGNMVAMTAIVGQRGNVEGAIIMKENPPDPLLQLQQFFQAILLGMAVSSLIGITIGATSGYVSSRGLVYRLQKLSQAAHRWSKGDFSTGVQDASEDELGQTTHQLNHMAEQLQNLLIARQKLATLEERNRLARDLHDSVKQQIFAISMQVGATKFLLRRDVDAAEIRLNETEKLVRQAQQELTSLIRELRPVALEGKGLVVALRELTTQWAQQTNIVANISAEDLQPLPLTIEEALFRIVQEALANVARHSKATLVQILLTTVDDTITLSIIDNGQGFDATQQGYLGVGLHSMQERMKALGGDVQIESSPEKGTRIIASCNRLGTVDATG